MRHLLLAVTLLGSWVIFTTPAWAQRRGGDEAVRYGWITSYERGQKEASRTGKPMMLVFRCVP